VGRTRLYETDAERQRAYRARAAAESEDQTMSSEPSQPREAPPVATGVRRVRSRPARLLSIITEIRVLQAEYEVWRGRLPEFQEGSDQADKLDEMIDVLEQATDLLAGADPPRGFGRD
jgi:hypothetical protein